MREESLRDLAPLAALGVLDGDDARAFAEAAASSPECRRELQAFERVVGLIALAERTVPPPAGLRRRVVGAVSPRVPAPQRTAPSRAGVALAAAAALACGIGWLSARWERESALRGEQAARVQLRGAETRLLALEQSLQQEQALRVLVSQDASRLCSLSGLPAAPGARARVVWNPENRDAVLLAAGLPPAPDGKAYAVWVIAGGPPAPAGVFQVAPDGSASFRLPPVEATATVKTFAVTVEPAAGTPAPTGPMVLAGSVS